MTPLMTLAHLVFAVATTLYILIAIQFEERDLVHDYGQAYEDYRRRVPMLVPSPGGATTVPSEIRSVSTWPRVS
jgi:protein-S-isoprenylcysteine O-methyltransferase Ste14